MPSWVPIVLSPLLGVVLWQVAYWVASHRGAPEGDTSFFWMQLLAWFGGGLWWLVTLLVLCVRTGLGLGWPGRPMARGAVVLLATLVDFGFLYLIYGETARGVGGDGWPADGVALTALGIAAIVAIAPVAWLWCREFTWLRKQPDW
jgi:hypothetical protein